MASSATAFPSIVSPFLSTPFSRAYKLPIRIVEKPWGRLGIPAVFDAPPTARIGEIWFDGGSSAPLLSKYLFTMERLSIQVHPSDAQARGAGQRRGKAECWYILDAAPNATIGIGLRRTFSEEEIRSALVDGTIEELISWRPVSAGDFLYVPPGTIHAIGGGISLLEFQQNSDVTYRLYDYGRPRELHIEEGLRVATLAAYPDPLHQPVGLSENKVLIHGPYFSLAHSRTDMFVDRLRWILPLDGVATYGGISAQAGECLMVEPGTQADHLDGRFLIGAVY